MLLAVIFMLALVVIALAVAAPEVAKQIQHDREVETMQRGKQYIRAVQLYYRKFHAYPPNVDALVKTNEIRFLRKRYVDPITGKDDWKPILFGQNKAPTAMGFFGQPLAGSSIAGVGPSGGNGLNGTSPPGGDLLNSSSGSGSLLGSSDSGATPAAPSGTPGTPADSSGNTGSPGSAGGADSGTGSAPGTGTGQVGQTGGQTFGGAGIIGFSPASPKQSILIYKKKNHYNEWEFVYDPLVEQMMIQGGNAGAIGQPVGATSNPVGSTGFGNSSFGSPGFGNSSFGSSPSPSSPPATPPATPATQQ
jgi:type II secretory pathway pseudopilin PulG